jgi:hypothetical protein
MLAVAPVMLPVIPVIPDADSAAEMEPADAVSILLVADVAAVAAGPAPPEANVDEVELFEVLPDAEKVNPPVAVPVLVDANVAVALPALPEEEDEDVVAEEDDADEKDEEVLEAPPVAPLVLAVPPGPPVASAAHEFTSAYGLHAGGSAATDSSTGAAVRVREKRAIGSKM